MEQLINQIELKIRDADFDLQWMIERQDVYTDHQIALVKGRRFGLLLAKEIIEEYLNDKKMSENLDKCVKDMKQILTDLTNKI
jgi:hypothetical protein